MFLPIGYIIKPYRLYIIYIIVNDDTIYIIGIIIIYIYIYMHSSNNNILIILLYNYYYIIFMCT